MGSVYLWVKAFHIVMVTSWFAGLFYLPRIFVNLALATEGQSNEAEVDRLLLMGRKLYRFMGPLMVLALLLGLWLWLGYGVGIGSLWMALKLIIVGALIAYHFGCGHILRQFEQGKNRRGHVWYRWFNEAPVIGLLVAVLLVVIKPF